MFLFYLTLLPTKQQSRKKIELIWILVVLPLSSSMNNKHMRKEESKRNTTDDAEDQIRLLSVVGYTIIAVDECRGYQEGMIGNNHSIILSLIFLVINLEMEDRI